MENADMKETCFAYSKELKCCRVLTEDLCINKGKCKFYLTEKQYEEKISKLEERRKQK